MGTKTLQKGVIGESACYLSEQSMTQDLCTFITRRQEPVHCHGITSEFDYAAGRADLVGLGDNDFLHAFETKLNKWRKALDQARRNTCFAHYSYVALPERAANVALKAKEEFRRHGVGLVVLNGNTAKLVIRPRRNSPLLPWLTKVALSLLCPNYDAIK